ncbi:MAG: TIR domain-containing protein, partial [Deltaproteobacteria bacterium]|nr:TIR domain-containing protein [Deltaproteobacteria bacterium]
MNNNYKFDTFLSYSSRDQVFVNKLWEDLRQNGIKVWIDQDKLLPGDLFVEAIEKGLNESRTVCMVVSPESLRSNWVREEYLRAIDLCVRTEQQRKVIPLILKEAEIPGFLSNRQWVDFSNESKYSDNLTYLVKGIKYSTPLLEADEGAISLNEILGRAKQTLLISGHTLDKFTDQSEVRTTLLSAMNSGVRVTIVLINPFCDYSRAHEPFHMLESRSPSREQITNSIRVLQNMFSVTNRPKNLTVLLSSYMPRFRTIIVDNDTIQISLYTYGADVGVAPEFTLTRTAKRIERSWFDTIVASTQQLVASKHVIPVIHDGIFHRNWEKSKYSFEMKNCLAKSCCQFGDNCWSGIQDSILGYQNSNRGEKAISLYRLVDRDFVPGLFTLSDINKGARFITPSTDYDNWLRNAVNEDLRLIEASKPDLVKGTNFREILEQVKQILALQTSSGRALRELSCYQEYSDILHRIIMTILTNNSEYEIELYSNITVDKTSLVLDVIQFLEKDNGFSLRDWLHFSIAAGLLGIENKTVNAATSAFDKTVGISLGNGRGDRATEVERIAGELVRTSRTPCRIDAS